ncbi:MAG: class I SAM-dependent methyltransferase [Acidobacteriota bacterium]|nr:class I SAM-dependent methyltransferase [Acidobacteriota bacterium]
MHDTREDPRPPLAAFRAKRARPGARKLHARALFAELPEAYDRAGAVMSFGQERRWREAMVTAVGATAGERVLDVATGTGLVAEALVRRLGCEVTGLDQSPEMLAKAQERLDGDRGLASHVKLVEGTAERLPFAAGEFDHLTFTYLFRYVDDPAATLRELARVVRPGGRIAALEFGVPPLPPLRALWSVHTRVGLPLLGALFSRQWSETGRFLAHSIPALYDSLPLDRQIDLWRSAGIEDVRVQRLSFGAGVVFSGTRAAGDPGEEAG